MNFLTYQIEIKRNSRLFQNIIKQLFSPSDYLEIKAKREMLTDISFLDYLEKKITDTLTTIFSNLLSQLERSNILIESLNSEEKDTEEVHSLMRLIQELQNINLIEKYNTAKEFHNIRVAVHYPHSIVFKLGNIFEINQIDDYSLNYSELINELYRVLNLFLKVPSTLYTLQNDVMRIMGDDSMSRFSSKNDLYFE